MAGDWIKMRVDLSEDPAVIAMADALQIAETHVVGLLHRAWSWADRQSQNGHAKSVTLSWLDRYIGVTGFAKAMVDAGWLEVNDGLKFPNFERHNGESAKKRAFATERKRAERWRHAVVADSSRKKRDKSVTREEKRRDNPIVPSREFERFWLAWPKSNRKGGKSKCGEVWAKGGFDLFIEQIASHVETMKLSLDWRKNAGEFIPAPLVYLNGRKWDGAETPAAEPRRAAV